MCHSTLSRSHPARVLLLAYSLGCFVGLSALAARAQDRGGGAEPRVLLPVAGPMALPGADSWTTFKGDSQRTGASNARVSLPLALGWRYSTDGPIGASLSAPLVLGAAGKQRLYFVVGNQMLCLDAGDGSAPQEWKNPQLASSVSAPLTLLSTEDGDFIVAATQGGRVGAYSAADGRQAWEIDLQNGIADAGPILVPTAGGPRIVVALGDGNLVALTPAGVRDPKWRVSLGQYSNPPASALALSPSGNLLYVVAADGKLYGIETQAGRVAWAVTLSGQTDVVPVVAGKIVVTTTVDRIAGFDANGGQPRWSVASRGVVSGSPAFRMVDAVPSVFYGNNNGDFYSLDARSGKQIWKTSLGTPISGSPVALANMVIVGTSNGLLETLNPKTGALLWQYRLKTERLLGNVNGTPNGGRGNGRGPQPASATGDDLAGARGGFQRVQLGGGGRFGRGGNVTAPKQQFSQPYGVSAAPSVVNGRVFVRGDDATIYAFTSQPIDADPPRVIEPSIALNDRVGNLTALLVGGNSAQSVPGRGPFYFAATLDDVGSGIDARSLQVSLDGAPVGAKNVQFDAASGVVSVTLLDGAAGSTNFPDGQKTLTISASDYAGNTVTSNFNFFIDNTAPAPAPTVQPAVPNGGTGVPNPGNPAFGPNDPNPGAPGGGGFNDPGPGVPPNGPTVPNAPGDAG